VVATAVLLVTLTASLQSPEGAPDAAVIESTSPSCVGAVTSSPNAPAVYQIVPDSNVPSGIAANAASA
jgi:hypothetical protein